MAGIGLVGTSGVGKTTLANAIREVTGVPFISSQVRPVYASFGIDPARQLDFDTKMAVQQKILDVAESDYKSIDSLFITDRTPIDFAAHAIVDVHVEGLNDRQTDELLEYVERCIRLTNLYFSSLILIQPGIQFAHREARPSNPAHLEHLNLVMTGLMADPDAKLYPTKHFLKKSIVDLDKRVEVVIKIASLVESLNMKQRMSAQEVH